jgi:hypothetical protein
MPVYAVYERHPSGEKRYVCGCFALVDAIAQAKLERRLAKAFGYHYFVLLAGRLEYSTTIAERAEASDPLMVKAVSHAS